MNILPPRTDTIPTHLKDRRQWVVWKAVPKANGKVDKVPFNARTGELASSTDPASWSSFDEAVEAYQRNPHYYAGIGYVFAADDPFAGVDLDACIDEHGTIADWAQEIITDLDTYAEISPGGAGIKAVGIGDLPSNAKQKSIELYDYARFFALTGHHLPQTPRDIRDAHDSLNALHARIKPAENDAPPRVTVSLAMEKTDHLQRYAARVATYATRMVAQAQDGEKHNVRIKAAKLYAGLIPHGLATESEIEAALYHAQPPKDHGQKELKAIRDAIRYGCAEPLDLPPEPEQPFFDEAGIACCPHGHGALVRSKNGNGWRCQRRDCFWWHGEGYTPPIQVMHLPRPERRLLHADELDALPPPTWHIDGEIPANAFVVLYGMTEGGKSFKALDYALRLAQKRNVVYVAAEGASGYAARKNAWCIHHNQGSGSLYFWPYTINMLNPQDVQEFLAAIAGIEQPFVILDTLARCMTGGDENSAKDMGIAIDAIDTIKRATGETVIAVHHTGKNGAAERGSSALRGAADVMIELQNDDGLITLSCSKMKDAPHFEPQRYRLLPVGNSCVIVPAEQVIVTRDTPLTERQRKVLEALDLAVFEDTGAKASQLNDVAPPGTLFRVLSELKRRGYIRQDAKGDPYYITEQGRQALRPRDSDRRSENELSRETTHPNAQLSQLSHDYHATIDSDTTLLSSLSHSLRSDSDSSSDSSLKLNIHKTTSTNGHKPRPPAGTALSVRLDITQHRFDAAQNRMAAYPECDWSKERALLARARSQEEVPRG